MDKREFVGCLSAALALHAVPGASWAVEDDGWKAAFHEALKSKPWLLGFLGAQSEVMESGPLSVQGRLPSDLRGVFFRNGPARHEVGNLRYHHWFDGDGMIQRFRFDGAGGVDHLGRMILTNKYREEKAEGKALYQGFGTFVRGRSALSADAMNAANINIVKHGKDLLALWEGGSAHSINPETLETNGIVTLSEETKGFPFGAHPRFDSDGTMWNIGYGPITPTLVVYHLAADGKLKNAWFNRISKPSMIHDFMLTPNYVVVGVPPFVIEQKIDSQKAFLDQFQWSAQDATEFIVYPRAAMDQPIRVQAPPMFIFHYGNAWEDEEGKIHFDFARYNNADIVTQPFREVMKGNTGIGSVPSYYTSAVIDPRAATYKEQMLQDPMLAHSEFLRFDPRRSTLRHQETLVLSSKGEADPVWNYRFSRVSVLNNQTGSIDTFDYGEEVFLEEHIVVPKPRDLNDFWVMGTSLHYPSGKTRLSVFEGRRLREGPIAVATVPFALPLGLHGNFVAT